MIKLSEDKLLDGFPVKNIADQLFPTCQREANGGDMVAQSVSQVSFVQQSRGPQQEKSQIGKNPDKSNRATRICFAAAGPGCDLLFLCTGKVAQNSAAIEGNWEDGGD